MKGVVPCGVSVSTIFFIRYPVEHYERRLIKFGVIQSWNLMSSITHEIPGRKEGYSQQDRILQR